MFVPDMRQDGFGGAILPGRVTGTGLPALLVHFEVHTDPRLKRLAQLAQRAGGEIVRSLSGERGLAVILTPGLSLHRDHWAALGVREHRLQSPRNYRDTNDMAGLRRLLDDAATAVGLKPDVFAPRVIGGNRFGETVYDGVLGRSLARKGVWHAEWQPGADGRRKGEIGPDAFLRGDRGIEAFSGSARGVAMMLMSGEAFDMKRLTRLHADILQGNPSLADRLGFRRGDFQEEIEAHLASMVPVAARRKPGREVALRVDGNMAAHNDRTGERMLLQQYSTPFPIARVASEVLLPSAGERLLEPTVGNGILASGFPDLGVKVTGVEIDPDRARRASRVFGADNIHSGDFLQVSKAWDRTPTFDLVVANPPFETLPVKEERRDAFGRNVGIRSLDHAIAFEALNRLKPDGRAFLVLPGDMIDNGALKGSKRYFDNWLRSSYEIAGSAVVDGRLYRKMGAQFPVILYAVGPRRDTPLSTEQIREIEPESLPVMVSHDELYAWADQTRERMAAAMGLEDVPDLAIEARAEPDRGSYPASPAASSPSTPSGSSSEPPGAAPAPGRQREPSSPASPRPSRGAAGQLIPPASGAAGGRSGARSGRGVAKPVVEQEAAQRIERIDVFHADPMMFKADVPSRVHLAATLDLGAMPADLAIDGGDEEATLEAAYRLTNSIDRAWWQTKAAGFMPAEAGLRSTSVGDVMRSLATDGTERAWLVDTAGFRALAAAEVAHLAILIRAAPQAVGIEAVEPEPAGSVLVQPVAPVPTPSLVPASPAEVPASAHIFDDIEDDAFVRRYQPFSSIGEAQTEIQKSLQGLVYRALLDVESKHGDVDSFVAAKLGITADELAVEDDAWGGRRFSPEQIDALALVFARQEDKNDAGQRKGFLLADLMGVGKGRTLAGTIVAAMAEERPAIFITDTPDLFTDFVARDLATIMRLRLRDMKATGAIKPFIVNQSADARIRDENRAAVFAVGDVKDAKENGIPDDRNLILATHSQFQTAHGVWKMQAILDWARHSAGLGKPVHLVIDEVHKAAGEESRTGDLMEMLVDGITQSGGTVVSSSATPLKSGRNVRIFKPMLPDMGMTTTELTNLIEQNPLALQEVLSGEMARMGTMVAREIDTRSAQRQFVHLEEINPDRYRDIVQAVDRASALLRDMIAQAPSLDNAAKRFASTYGSKGGGVQQKVSVQTTSPVAQFHTYSQYLMLAVKTAYSREMIVQSIASGNKPILVVENTGQQALTRLVEREGEDRIVGGVPVRVIPRLPNIGDILVENASKMLDVRIVDPIGGTIERRLAEFEPWLDEFTDRVREAKLDGLTLSAIDTIAKTAGELGLSMGELTKRHLVATPLDDGSFAVANRDVGDKRRIIRDFNNGDLDLLVINRSAAVGVSIHASPETGWDLRPRQMIKLQFQSDVTAERQIDGRIHRYGMVHDGRYMLPMTGFAADDRLMQLFNRKNRSLTATSNATRENRSNIDEAADLLNVVGEWVVREYLIENPHIQRQLGLPSPAEAEAGDGYARKMMGRLVCLPKQVADAVMSEIDTSFKMKIEALDAAGTNPLRLRQFDWRATVEPVAVLQAGDEKSDQLGKRPVTLVKLTYYEPLVPLSAERVDRMVERGRAASVGEGGGRALTMREKLGELFDPSGEPAWSSPAYDKALNRRPEDRSMGLQVIENEIASEIWHDRSSIVFEKASVPQKRVLRAIGYATFLDRHVDALEPGRLLHLKTDFFPFFARAAATAASQRGDEDKSDVPAVVTRVSYRENDPLALGGWSIGVAVPGERYADELTISAAFAAHDAMDAETKAMHPIPTFYRYDGASLRAPASPGASARPSVPEVLARSLDADHAWFTADAPHWRDHVRGLFDNAPSGQIKRTVHALEGNMFVALRITQGDKNGKRLGQKAIYTNAAGEIRHGVVLKEGEDVARLKLDLAGRVDALATALPYRRPELVAALLQTYTTLRATSAHYEYIAQGEVPDRLKGQLTDHLTTLLARGQDLAETRAYVESRLDGLAREMLKAMPSTAAAELYVGTDAFGELFPGSWKTWASEREARNATHKTFVGVYDEVLAGSIVSMASTIGPDDLHAIVRGAEIDLIFHKKGKVVVEAGNAAGIDDFLKRASNTMSGTSSKLTKGALGMSLYAHGHSAGDKAAVMLTHVAEASKQAIMARGPIARMSAVVEAHVALVHGAAIDRQFEQGLGDGTKPDPAAEDDDPTNDGPGMR